MSSCALGRIFRNHIIGLRYRATLISIKDRYWVRCANVKKARCTIQQHVPKLLTLPTQNEHFDKSCNFDAHLLEKMYRIQQGDTDEIVAPGVL